jgi:flagellar hook-length control protein FliK
MAITFPLTSRPQPVTGHKEPSLPFKIDQQLSVKVTQIDLTKNALTLQWGGNTLQVAANRALKPADLPAIGDKLNVQVVKLSPAPEFQVMRHETLAGLNTPPLQLSLIPSQTGVTPSENLPTNANPVPKLAPQNLSPLLLQQPFITATLRQLVAHQSSPAQFLTQLLRDLPALQQSNRLSTALKTALQNMIQTLPQIQHLTDPQTLQQTLQNSGLFLEAKLLQRLNTLPTPLQQDFKANLLKLKSALHQQLLQPDNEVRISLEERTLLTELQQKTGEAISKLMLEQLASLPKDDSPKQLWHLEIPVLMKQTVNTLTLEIERDSQNTTAANPAPCWSVTLTLTPPGLGTLYCKISAMDNTLNTYFRSEDEQTLTMIEQHIEQLRAQFKAAGLNPGHIDSQKGHLHKKLSQKLANPHLFQAKA